MIKSLLVAVFFSKEGLEEKVSLLDIAFYSSGWNWKLVLEIQKDSVHKNTLQFNVHGLIVCPVV